MYGIKSLWTAILYVKAEPIYIYYIPVGFGSNVYSIWFIYRAIHLHMFCFIYICVMMDISSEIFIKYGYLFKCVIFLSYFSRFIVEIEKKCNYTGDNISLCWWCLSNIARIKSRRHVFFFEWFAFLVSKRLNLLIFSYL